MCEELTLMEEILSKMPNEPECMALHRIGKIGVDAAVNADVEGIMSELAEPLQVVRNVSLAEVKKNMPLWKPAIKKEMDALYSSGKVKRISVETARQLANKGKVVPVLGKAVFTAKPPAEKGWSGATTDIHITLFTLTPMTESSGDSSEVHQRGRLCW